MTWDAVLKEFGPWGLLGFCAFMLVWKVFLPMLDERDAVVEKALTIQRQQADLLVSTLKEQIASCSTERRSVQEEFLRSLRELETDRKEEVRNFLAALRERRS